MTSEAVVWTWLPGAVAPVPAGRLRATQGGLAFAYARSYLDRADAISLYGPELPLRSGPIEPLPGLAMPSCLRDGSPDAWGRRVIATRMTGNPDDDSLTEVDLMLLSGSNRIGANDFQARPDAYVARSDTAPVADLLDAAERLDAGERLPAEIAAALVHGTSVGGARPKILLRDNGVEFLAKLSSSTDRYPVVKAEAAAMALARMAGIDAAETSLRRISGRDALLVRRFDRVEGARRHVVSGLTLLGLEEMAGRYATYPDLVAVLTEGGDDAAAKVFERIAAYIALGNFDDHARNHAAFWDGRGLTLTPAYDICPPPRSGETAYQAMAYGLDGQRAAELPALVRAAPAYGLTIADARSRVDRIVDAVESGWADAADEAKLSAAERDRLWRRLILNPASVRGLR